MKLLTNEQQELNENAKICYINNEKFEDKYAKCKNLKLEIIVIKQVNTEVLYIVKQLHTEVLYIVHVI